MNVKEAVGLAVNHIRDLFEHEDISNLGLEEVEFDSDMQQWVVTVGFSRPWDYPSNTLAALGGHGHASPALTCSRFISLPLSSTFPRIRS